MKKTILTSLFITLTSLSLAAEPQTASANVKVTAQVVSDNLVISDLNGRPIVLDFGKISNQKTSGVSNARVDFKVEKVGDPVSDLTGITVSLAGLNNDQIDLLNTNVAAQQDKTITASIALNTEEGTFDGNQYIGFIQGTIAAEDSLAKSVSTYENILVLNATTK